MRGSFRSRLAIGVLALIAALSLAAVAVPAAMASKIDDFNGKVVSTDRHPRSVKVDTRSRGNIRFKVNQQTKYDHLNGFSALKPDLKVEVHARHTSGGWVATKIDRRS
jgi:uncharacterized protein DUF5666